MEIAELKLDKTIGLWMIQMQKRTRKHIYSVSN